MPCHLEDYRGWELEGPTDQLVKETEDSRSVFITPQINTGIDKQEKLKSMLLLHS